MKKILLALFLPLCLTTAAFTQTSAERHQKIRQALDHRDFTVAFRELQSFRKTEAKVFEANNLDYLLGRVAEKNNDPATALSAYQAVVARKSVLQNYALWHLSQLWRAGGNLMLERLFLQRLLSSAPDGLQAEAARFRLARSFYESRDYQAVVNSQWVSNAQLSSKPVENKQKNDAQIANEREWQALFGQAFLHLGDKEKAREIFTKLIIETPKPDSPDDFALAATRGLDELDAANPPDVGKIAPQLPDTEHFRRGAIYQFNRAFTEASLHFEAIVERYPNSALTPDALLRLGRIAVLQDRYDAAITYFERVQGQFALSISARDALAAEASAYARSGNSDEAIARYKQFIAKYIEAGGVEKPENSERAYLNIIDALRDKGRDADALTWVTQTRARFRNQLADAQALFSQTRVHLSQGDWASTLRDLTELENASDLGGTKVSGGTNKIEIAFLKAYCLEQSVRFDEAINLYLAIPDGRAEYYGQRATERLQDLAENVQARDFTLAKFAYFRALAIAAVNANDAEQARQTAQNALRLTANPNQRAELFEILKRAYAVLPAYKNAPNGEMLTLGRQKLVEKPAMNLNSNQHQTLADELLFLGLDDEAAPELAAVQSPKSKVQSPKSKDYDFTLAVISKRGDSANQAVAYAEPLWRNVPADYLVELAPRESIELLYPAPYNQILLKSAARNNLDPRFALSIMRQESRYRPDVKSIAAARGLMQFIPSTAAQIAAELNQNNFAPNDLYDPATAILFGTHYLNNIFKQFPDQPQAVAASYNGGEANMMRWLLRSKSTEPDRYVAEIQFTQSKDYVYKVLANYRTYQMLYDEHLQRK